MDGVSSRQGTEDQRWLYRILSIYLDLPVRTEGRIADERVAAMSPDARAETGGVALFAPLIVRAFAVPH